MVKRGAIILLLLCLFLISGCWDMMDIEEHNYVSGIAFDEPEKKDVERQRQNLEEAELFTPRYSITYIAPIPATMVGEGSGEEQFNAKSITAVNPDEAERQMATRTNRDLYFGYTDLVLFGEKLLKEPDKVKELMDYLHRNQEFNWDLLVGVVEGEAKDAFSIKPVAVSNLVKYIRGIMENRPVTSKVADVSLDQMMVDMGDDGTMALPRVTVSKDEVKVEGAALIKDFQLQDYFTGNEARSIIFLKGTMEGGGIVVRYRDRYIPYTIVNASTKQELITTEEGLQMTYTIESEGQLDQGIYGENFLDNKVIRGIESEVEKEIVKDCTAILEELQEDYQADVIYAGDYIRKYHPKIWSQVKDDWDQEFSEMDIRVEAEVEIRRTGVVK